MQGTSPGSESGARGQGSPRNLGGPHVSSRRRPGRGPETSPGFSPHAGCGVRRAKKQPAREVALSEGNEATRDGHEGVGVTHGTDEASEREPEGAGGGKGWPGNGTERKER